MPPQIKHDLNRSGWETTDLPSVCERCLPQNNPYVQMLKEDYGEACKLCTRPFTVFRWKADRTSRQKRTGICLTCARLKNCCQCCMLDLSFGLPISVRDAALKMVAPGPQSEVNREFFAQNNEREIEEGRGLEGYSQTDDKARELLRRLAQTEPYYKKQRRLEAEAAAEGEGGQKLLEGGEQPQLSEPGPIRTKDSKERKSAYGSSPYSNPSSRLSKAPARKLKAQPIKPEDILPPADKNIKSLFVTGVEDDLPEHALRTYFAQFGPLQSLVCSHRSHCAFVNYTKREAAELAAEKCQGKAIVAAVPLRVQWKKPRALDSMDRDQRLENARAGRAVAAGGDGGAVGKRKAIEGAESKEADWDALAAIVAAPPGQDEGVEYAALAGE